MMRMVKPANARVGAGPRDLTAVHAAAGDLRGLVPDPWLSERMNRAAYSLSNTAEANIEPAHRPAFIQARVDISDNARADALMRAGYALVETAVGLAKDLSRGPADARRVRFAQSGDETDVREIASCAFMYSRFHADRLIPAAVANRIKEDWAANFFTGRRGTHMAVAQDRDRVVGFLLLIVRGDDLIIDLVGVSPAVQGRGFGRAMLDFAAARVEGPRRFVVGTQLSNFPSLAYYTGYGFRVVSALHSLHRHFL